MSIVEEINPGKHSITEQDKEVIEAWYKERPDDINAFIDKLHNNYEHDYGTVCHAMAAAGIAAMWKFNDGSQGGITGFQANAVMWEVIKHWMNYDSPMRLINFDKMLYPQYDYQFEKTISKETWEWLQKEAARMLAEKREKNELVSRTVLAHWQSIVDGIIPFGYTVSDND